ncbi:cryptic family protein 1B-like [Dugong dugon]
MSGYQKEKHKGGKEGINNATTQERQQKTLNWTLNNFSKVNGSAEGWRQQRDTLPHSWGFRESASTRSSCCQNGGTCVLGSFCVCPAHFTGRHCEHDPKRSECGALAHGAWTVHGCRLCRCVYGALRCLARQTQGSCDPKDFLTSYSDGLSSQHTLSFLVLLLCFLLQCLVLCGYHHQ